uniref:Uncharacterized protein n=1 Tax=Gouania willdenowi TaxID=441366 RepID=A0A8C5EVH8_GOUWI
MSNILSPGCIMSQPAQLRMILADYDVRKLVLPSGIPETVDDLHSVICDTFSIARDFRLHYKDVDFGDEFFTLFFTSDLKDKDTVKVVFLQDQEPTITLTLNDVTDTDLTNVTDQLCEEHYVDDISSVRTDNTLITTSEDSPGHRSQRWPAQFLIPSFSNLTEIQIQTANERLKKYGTLFLTKDFIPLLPDILGKLAEAIFKYTAYPSSLQISEVAEALTQKHPYLKEPGSYNGSYGWAQRLKYKMNNFRSKLRGLGCPEVEINSLKRKTQHDQYPAKSVKKPKKAEVNYLPPHAQGETSASLEKERVELLNEVVKRDNFKVVAQKMAKTFSLRREEIVKEAPAISDFMKRWPALFCEAQVCEKFKRLTTVSLELTFLAKLDHCTPKLMALTQSKGGATGLKIRQIKDMLLETSDGPDLTDTPVALLTVVMDDNTDVSLFSPESICIVVEDEILVSGPTNLADSFLLLFGYIYALDLQYPKNLQLTFTFIQQVVMCLEDNKPLKGRLLVLNNDLFNE